jgi:hypothetical protein
MFVVSRRAEQLRLRSQQFLVITTEESVLRTEMTSLESQKEDAPKRILGSTDQTAGEDQDSS